MKSLNEQAYEYIQDVIKNQALTYQQTYSETKLAKELFQKLEENIEHTCKEHLAILNDMKEGKVKDIYETTLLHINTPKDINLEDLSISN